VVVPRVLGGKWASAVWDLGALGKGLGDEARGY
jgi:hypothetical protein